MKAVKKDIVGAGLRRATWFVGALALGACSGDYAGQEPSAEGASFAEAEEGATVGGDEALAEGAADTIAEATGDEVVSEAEGEADLEGEEVALEFEDGSAIEGAELEGFEAVDGEGAFYKAACAIYQLGGSTSCKSTTTWIGYARDRCAAKKQRLTAVRFLNPCGGTDYYRYIRYQCCP